MKTSGLLEMTPLKKEELFEVLQINGKSELNLKI